MVGYKYKKKYKNKGKIIPQIHVNVKGSQKWPS